MVAHLLVTLLTIIQTAYAAYNEMNINLYQELNIALATAVPTTGTWNLIGINNSACLSSPAYVIPANTYSYTDTSGSVFISTQALGTYQLGTLYNTIFTTSNPNIRFLTFTYNYSNINTCSVVKHQLCVFINDSGIPTFTLPDCMCVTETDLTVFNITNKWTGYPTSLVNLYIDNDTTGISWSNIYTKPITNITAVGSTGYSPLFLGNNQISITSGYLDCYSPTYIKNILVYSNLIQYYGYAYISDSLVSSIPLYQVVEHVQNGVIKPLTPITQTGLTNFQRIQEALIIVRLNAIELCFSSEDRNLSFLDWFGNPNA